jgi:DNA-directed RNA polymerase specialized sigma subunit
MNKSFFSELPKDLMTDKDKQTASDTIFDAFNDAKIDITTTKNRNNYIKSTFRAVGFRKEIAIDNNVLSTFFSADENATSRSLSHYDDDEEERLAEIRFIIHNLLPDFERDIMTLIFDYNKIQEDIGVILGLSQEMVNYYKKRAIHRILHFYNNRKIDVNDMRNCLAQHMSKRQLEAMMLYFLKHNQRIVSKELGISQSAVSARLKQGLKKLKRKVKVDERAAKYYLVFDNLTKQKSLYSSQTRMKVMTQVDNYAQFNGNSDNDERDRQVSTVPIKTVSHKKPIKLRKLSITKSNNRLRHKKIKFDRIKLKKLRSFFKR